MEKDKNYNLYLHLHIYFNTCNRIASALVPAPVHLFQILYQDCISTCTCASSSTPVPGLNLHLYLCLHIYTCARIQDSQDLASWSICKRYNSISEQMTNGLQNRLWSRTSSFFSTWDTADPDNVSQRLMKLRGYGCIIPSDITHFISWQNY